MYIKKMEKILSDQVKFQKATAKDEKFLNFVTRIFKKLVDSKSLSRKTQRHLKPLGTRPGIMYGSCKVYKKCASSCLPFRPILSALKIPTCKLAKHLVPTLEPLTNKFTKICLILPLKLLSKILVTSWVA